MFILIFYQRQKESQNAARIARKKCRSKKLSDKEKIAMNELIRSMNGIRCIIYMVGGRDVDGTLEVPENNSDWIKVVTANGQCEIINTEYIERIREYPVNKKGKPKQVVLD
jgi:hypothetical protein